MRMIVGLLALVVSTSAAMADCAMDRVDLRGDWGRARFTVEIADDPQERARGLMHRETMARSAGMIFIYERPQAVSFWMENTLIPLDMLFLDESGTVTRVHSNAVPLDRTAIPGGDGVLAVLEINGGLAERLGVEEGTELRHPGLPQDAAAWPCD